MSSLVQTSHSVRTAIAAAEAERRQDYDAYLNSEAWKRKRLRAIERDNHRCRVCNSARRLDVHHRTYERFGRESLDDLTTLCRGCHEMFHGRSFTQPTVKTARAPRSRFHGEPAHPTEKVAVLAAMEPSIEYITAEIAAELNMTPQRTGTVLASLRRGGKVVRTRKLWRLRQISELAKNTRRMEERARAEASAAPQADAA